MKVYVLFCDFSDIDTSIDSVYKNLEDAYKRREQIEKDMGLVPVPQRDGTDIDDEGNVVDYKVYENENYMMIHHQELL